MYLDLNFVSTWPTDAAVLCSIPYVSDWPMMHISLILCITVFGWLDLAHKCSRERG